MGTLAYTIISSLDGYMNDIDGDIVWAAPTPEVFTFLNEREAWVHTQLYGRRAYEVMVPWETDAALIESGENEREFAEWWQRTDKIVYSTTLDEVVTGNTRLERTFHPDAVRRLKEESPGDLSVFGPTLAAHAFDAGLVDEVRLYLRPRTLGGGTPALPRTRLRLKLLEERRFQDGTVYLGYAVRP
ncbi:MAG TPA: dihydrofolate reductase family protein [Actinomycetaceae bacterium]|nr:dihydrofolate reductase family protein [Actinomycetaceae bacterium]